MPKITSVEPQKKNTKRFNVFLDGEFGFGADEDLVVNHRLIVGKEVSTDDLDQILFEAEVGKLMEKMYRLFNIRQRSEKEVRDYLRIKNYELKILGKEQYSDLVVESTIESLKKKGMINDEQFARSWVESRSKKYGPHKVKGELIKKGIDREIIEEVVRLQVTGFSGEIAQKLLEKKIERWKNLEHMEVRKKAVEFLMRRGFEYDTIKDIVENLLEKR